MSNIEYIKNVTAYTSFARQTGEPGEFSCQLTSMPDLMPHEAIIRTIVFNGETTDVNVYLLWSNLTNDIICSFSGVASTAVSPGIVIRFTGPIPNNLEFKIFTPADVMEKDFVNVMKGDIAINIDFIKYKRV